MTIIDACWQDLAEAIVLQAVEDYRMAKMSLLAGMMDPKAATRIIRRCERFFRSQWFEDLTGLDGKKFLQRIKEGFSFR